MPTKKVEDTPFILAGWLTCKTALVSKIAKKLSFGGVGEATESYRETLEKVF